MRNEYEVLKRAKVTYVGDSFSIYRNGKTVIMEFVKPIKYGGKIRISPINMNHTCRELMCWDLLRELSGDGVMDYSSFPGKLRTKVFIRGCSTMSFYNVNYTNMVTGIRVINYLENLAGFEHKTYIRDMGNKRVLIVGPDQWLRTIPHFSLYLMLLKIISFIPINHLEKWTSYLKRASITKATGISQTCNYLRYTLNKKPKAIKSMMENYESLVKTVKYKDAYLYNVSNEGLHGVTTFKNISECHSKFVQKLEELS